MKKKSLWVVALAATLTACDSNFDLANLDKEIEAKVEDLVVPLNIDKVNLDPILNLEENSKIKRDVVNNTYSFEDSGTFHSNSVSVDGFSAKGTNYSETDNVQFDKKYDLLSTDLSKIPAGTLIYEGIIPDKAVKMEYSASGIDKSIISIDELGFNSDIVMSFKFGDINKCVNKVALENIKVQFMKGLSLTLSTQGATYDPSTGVITFPKKIYTDNNCVYTEKIKVTKINAVQSGIVYKDHAFSIKDNLKSMPGSYVNIYSDDLKPGIDPSKVPSTTIYTVSVNIGEASVNSFTGILEKDIDGVNVDPITLNNLPELLHNSGTTLRLDGTNLTLDLNNPLIEAGVNLTAQCGLQLQGVWGKTEGPVRTTDNKDAAIVMNKAQNSYYIAKTDDPAKSAGKQFVMFSEIGDILYNSNVTGIPDKVMIDVLSPKVPQQKVVDFKLPNKFNAVNGKWQLHAPLSITSDSKVIYSKSWNAADEEELQNINLKAAGLTCEVSTDVPAEVELTININGKNAKMQGKAKVPANAKNVPINVTLDGGPVNGFTTIDLNANISGTSEPLGPNQNITVSNVRLKVTGSYTKELD